MLKEWPDFEYLMKESLNLKNDTQKRAELFNDIYESYIKIDEEGKNWDAFRIKLRKKYANKLTQNQKKKYSLKRVDLKKSFYEIKKYIPKSQKSFFPPELFYEISFILLQKVSKRKDKILDIGYGEFPTLINLLNKKGYDAYGLEPYAKQFDRERTFRCKIKDIPKKLEKMRFKVILANMVYSACYTTHYSDNFSWELENREKIIKKFNSLLEKNGFLILIDDMGSIFSKEYLKKYFKVLLFEKDIGVINFDSNKVEDFVRITLLQKM